MDMAFSLFRSRRFWIGVFAVSIVVVAAATAKGDALDEVNLQRTRIGLPPLIHDAELMKFAQMKAEYQAQHNIWGHAGPRFGEVGVTEGTGVTTPQNTQGWLSCASDSVGQWPAGAGCAYDTQGRRFNCLLLRCPNSTPDAIQTQAYLIPTYHLTKAPIVNSSGIITNPPQEKRVHVPDSATTLVSLLLPPLCPDCNN